MHFVGEISGLLFHTSVLAARQGIGLDQIRSEMERRCVVKKAFQLLQFSLAFLLIVAIMGVHIHCTSRTARQ